MPDIIRTVYLKTVFEPAIFQAAVEKTIEEAKKLRKETEYDTIAFSGTSGHAMAFILGHALNIPLLLVRKEKDGSHYSGYRSTPLEGNFGTRRYLVVDDFISSGRTANYIINCINKELPLADCAAILLYADRDGVSHRHPQTDKPLRVVTSRPKEAE
jgi:adenine/guanine phosphoribosyltransferase-like PRPP-binding protein